MKNHYYKQYQKEIETVITGSFSEDGKNYFQVEENIFYPQGGGQKGDRGWIEAEDKKYRVLNTIKDQYSDDGVLIEVEDVLPSSMVGSVVKILLDWDFRFIQMRLHSLVHLHHCFMEKVIGKKLPYPKTSDIQDGFAFNRYDSSEISEDIAIKASALLADEIKNGSIIKTYPDETKKGFRWWECLDFKVPCGGTHPENISEIGLFETSFSRKKGMSTVTFKLTK